LTIQKYNENSKQKRVKRTSGKAGKNTWLSRITGINKGLQMRLMQNTNKNILLKLCNMLILCILQN